MEWDGIIWGWACVELGGMGGIGCNTIRPVIGIIWRGMGWDEVGSVGWGGMGWDGLRCGWR